MDRADGSLGYCSRCAREVPLMRPWPGFRWLKRAWYAGLLVVLALMPIILSEITVLLPMAMIFAVAGGPVLSLAAQPVTCKTCGAVVPGLKATSDSRRIH
jgi:hypothetical protein